MRILIVTALYPPEVSPVAAYCKELAKRLSTKPDKVTVLTYTTLPEELEMVQMIKVSKQLPLPIRLMIFSAKLFMLARKADIIYVENGASVELPVYVTSFFFGTPFVIHIGDKRADNLRKKSLALRWIWNLASARACSVIDNMPLEKPEILPFSKLNEADFNKYTSSWEIHLKILEKISKKYTTI